METEKLLNNDKESSAMRKDTKDVSVSHAGTLKAAEFAFSFFGLIISYVTWGVMQELIMSTHFHPTPLVPSGMFPSSMYIILYIVGFVWLFFLASLCFLQVPFVYFPTEHLPSWLLLWRACGDTAAFRVRRHGCHFPRPPCRTQCRAGPSTSRWPTLAFLSRTFSRAQNSFP